MLFQVIKPFIYSESIKKALRPDITYEGDYAYLVGWGSEKPIEQPILDMESVEYNSFLKEISFEVLPFEDCKNLFEIQKSVLHPRNLCARSNSMLGKITTGNAAHVRILLIYLKKYFLINNFISFLFCFRETLVLL